MKISKKLFISIVLALGILILFLSNQSNATNKEDITSSNYYASIEKTIFEYTGKEIKPKVELIRNNPYAKLKLGKDYTVTYEDNINIGTGKKVIIKGKGNYTGTKYVYYVICKYNLYNVNVSAIPDQEYTGKEIKPSNFKVTYKGKTLKEGKDYIVNYPSYSSVTPVGTAYISLEGAPNSGFYGYKSISYNVLLPKITKVSTTLKTNGIKISWKKPSLEVDGYEICRYTSTNKQEKVIAYPSKGNLSYLDTTPATSGKTYYYKIRSYKYVNGVKIYSNYSSISSIIFVQGVNYNLSSGNDRTYLSWDKVNGATAYQIFRSTSKNGKYVRIKTIKGQNNCKYTDKKIKKFTKYYYKIRAYSDTSNGRIYGNFTGIKTKEALAQTNLKNAKYTGNSIKLSWKKVNDIKGYKIYRATSQNGKYSKIATVSSKKTSYKDYKLSQGKVYFYRIRTYKNRSGKELHGQYSEIKSAITGNRQQQLNKTTLSPDKDFKNSSLVNYYNYYKKLINKNTNSNMSTYTKVKTMYKYLVQHMYHKDGYNCKNYAGTFAGICRVMGLNAYCPTGQTRASGGGYTAHTWAVVNVNSTEYIFDASLDRHSADRTKKSTSYNYFFKTYDELPGVYQFQGYENYWSWFMVGPNENL